MLKKGMSRNDDDSPLKGWEPFRWVNVGPGVVGRTVPVAICFFALLGVAIWRVPDAALITPIVGLAALLAVGYFALVFWFANKYPDFSTLDGGSLVDYRRTQLGAKDPAIIEINPKIVPNNSVPELPDTSETQNGL